MNSIHILQMHLSDPHHAGLGTAVHVPKCIILAGWAQYSVAKLFCFLIWIMFGKSRIGTCSTHLIYRHIQVLFMFLIKKCC